MTIIVVVIHVPEELYEVWTNAQCVSVNIKIPKKIHTQFLKYTSVNSIDKQ